MRRVAELTDEELERELAALLDADAHDWTVNGRPDQMAPPQDPDPWDIWLMLGGRGSGKTRAMMEDAAKHARRFPGMRIGLVSQTQADARDTLVEGDSGLLNSLTAPEMRGGSIDAGWNRSLGELFMANGSRFKCYSSEKPRSLRGPQHHRTYGDEIAQWFDAKDGTRKDTTWSNMVIGTRLPRRRGWPPDFKTAIVAATTPKAVALLRSRDPENPGLLESDFVAITRATTEQNITNLSDTYKRQVVVPLLGTRLGLQELNAVMLDDVEGALFLMEQIEMDRVRFGEVPGFHECVVGVDPAVTSKETSDHTGIVCCGLGIDGHGYVMEDATLRGSPLEWGAEAWLCAGRNDAEAIVIEDNQGGDMVETTLNAAWPGQAANYYAANGKIRPAIRRVHSVKDKRARAVPISLLYERHQIHHALNVGLGKNPLLLLEGEMTEWDGTGDSPDRMDALVHAFRWLYKIGVKTERLIIRQRWGGGRQ